MKTFRIIGTALMTVILGVSITACDDNEKVEELNYEIDYSDITKNNDLSKVNLPGN